MSPRPTMSFQDAEHGSAPLETMLCFSHLRWDFVFQRPQHLMTRFAQRMRVYYIEEPVFEECGSPRLALSSRESGVVVVVPMLPHGLAAGEVTAALRLLTDRLLAQEAITDYSCWFYTPLALAHADHLSPRVVAYDCMDELSNFAGAPPSMSSMEQRLMARADVMFTGGQSLYDAKRDRHGNIHVFPSSIDRAHFAQARQAGDEPAAQRALPHPRLGFFGVIDERFDTELVAGIARLRPDWQLVIVGPVVKIDPASLPQAANIHYPGMTPYARLPDYLRGWDVAIMPFAINDATRFISPTKTPEYLAGGKPVVSSRIHDVVHPYGTQELVFVAETAEAFVAASEAAMHACDHAWLERVDAFLAEMSWDATWLRMNHLLCVAARATADRGAQGFLLAGGRPVAA
jgi:glycosyltransferase involved in cell wall biosynthesis